MADVMVVAIFMAYIGFNGIITNQIDKLNAAAGQEQGILTTNGTSLEPGYYLFFAFTLLGLFLSGFLTRVGPGQQKETDQPEEKNKQGENIKSVPSERLEIRPTREESTSLREVNKPKQNVDDSGKYNTLKIDERIDIKRISTVLEQPSTPRANEKES